jgi:N-acetylmuramoyl-L-alanine amidase
MAHYVGIDIGHGENTWETGGGKGVKKDGKVYEEHHFNSTVAMKVEDRLHELGIKTYMAQKPFQNDVPLGTRTRNYNAQKVDLVVSIHANSATASAKGAGAFYWHTSSNSKKLAQYFMKHWLTTVNGVGQYSTGAIASVPKTWTNFHMCRETAMPSILVEAGFMTNANDFEYIFGSKKDTYTTQVAETIVKAVCEYLGVTYKASGNKAPAKTPEVSDVVPAGSYKIKAGDTLYSIARDAGIGLDVLQKANPTVKASALKIGSYLVIPNGKEVKKGNQTTTSIVTYLQSIGVDSSYTNRKALAKKYGITNYAGTASQNLQLLKAMRGH